MNNTETTFWETICGYRIVIPRIQRDYVQGRRTRLVENARDALLADVRESCATGRPTSLNFVYGEVEGPEGNARFVPLDGQQRLTTLYLLHWFALLRSDLDPSAGCDMLSKFTYETRTSSAGFFSRLADPEHVQELRRGQGRLSELVWDKSWFRPEWADDPTVQSCLVVLDCLQERFSDVDGLWETLTSEGCPVRFEWLDIRDIGNEDDLYIKMNARGKVLSPFENLKAEIEQEAAGLLDADELEEFAANVDGRWSDLVWGMGEPARHEDRFMSLVNWSLWNRWAVVAQLRSDYSGLETRQKDCSARTLRDFSAELEEGASPFGREWLRSFSRTLDAVSAEGAPADAVAIVAGCTGAGHDVGYADMFMLQALSSYLDGTGGSFDDESWRQWARVMGNLARSCERYQGFNNIGRFASAVKCVDGLSEHAGDVLSALADDSIEIEGIIPGEQVTEERMKARLMLASPAWRRAIERAEAMPYFMGKVMFLLEFSGLRGTADCAGACEGALASFEAYTAALEELFGPAAPAVDGALLRRALLTKGDFSVATRQLRTYLVDNDRRIDWRAFLRMYDGEHRRANGCLKALLDDLLGRSGPMEERLQDIVGEYSWDEGRGDWWAKRLIEDEAAFKALGSRRQFRPVSERWSVPVLMMPAGANQVASGRNRELVTTVAANELNRRGWSADLHGSLGIQPGRYCTVGRDGRSFGLGLAEFSSAKPYVVWDGDGRELGRFKADPGKMVACVLAAK